MTENQLRKRFETLTADEPPLPNTTDEIVTQGRRRLRRFRVAAGTTSALGVSAVAIAAAAVLLPPGDAAEPGFATGGDSGSSDAAAEEDAGDETGIVSAPAARDLSGDEVEEAFDTCRSSAEGIGDDGYAGWKPVAGVSIDADVPSGLPTTWVIARRGDDYRADCSVTADGRWYGGGGEYGVKSTPALLYAPVDGQEARTVGRYVDPVARVTVQYEDGPEREAVTRDGFWFLPYDYDRFEPPAEAVEDDRPGSEGEEAAAGIRPDRDWLIEHGYQPDLIGVPLGYTFRGYDADGELVYDSSTDGPSVTDCYADPTGSEFVGNWADFDDPAECVRTHRWEPQD